MLVYQSVVRHAHPNSVKWLSSEETFNNLLQASKKEWLAEVAPRGILMDEFRDLSELDYA